MLYLWLLATGLMRTENTVLIKNKMTGLPTPVLKSVFEVYKTLELAEFNFKTFVAKYHDYTSIESAEFYMELLETYEKAQALFKPYKNEWLIAREGCSLN
jgi:hypothetical protein